MESIPAPAKKTKEEMNPSGSHMFPVWTTEDEKATDNFIVDAMVSPHAVYYPGMPDVDADSFLYWLQTGVFPVLLPSADRIRQHVQNSFSKVEYPSSHAPTEEAVVHSLLCAVRDSQGLARYAFDRVLQTCRIDGIQHLCSSMLKRLMTRGLLLHTGEPTPIMAAVVAECDPMVSAILALSEEKEEKEKEDDPLGVNTRYQGRLLLLKVFQNEDAPDRLERIREIVRRTSDRELNAPLGPSDSNNALQWVLYECWHRLVFFSILRRNADLEKWFAPFETAATVLPLVLRPDGSGIHDVPFLQPMIVQSAHALLQLIVDKKIPPAYQPSPNIFSDCAALLDSHIQKLVDAWNFVVKRADAHRTQLVRALEDADVLPRVLNSVVASFLSVCYKPVVFPTSSF